MVMIKTLFYAHKLGFTKEMYQIFYNGREMISDITKTGNQIMKESKESMHDFFFVNEKEIIENMENDILNVELQVSLCIECYFTAVIFWKEIAGVPAVTTFYGESEFFELSDTGQLHEITMDVYLVPTGSIRCKSESTNLEGEVSLAAMDEQTNVILPPVTGVAGDQGIDIVLPDIPIGRKVSLLHKPDHYSDYVKDPISSGVVVEAEGDEVLVEFE